MLGNPAHRKTRRMGGAGAPPWMTTFADLSILLLSFFVLLLSFSEVDVEKYKQIAGSMRMAFGVQRQVYARDTPMGTSFVAREFSPGRPEPTPLKRVEQRTAAVPRAYLGVRPASVPLPERPAAEESADPAMAEALRQVKANLRRIQALLGEEIERGLVDVERQGARIIIRIRERGSFPSGSARLIEPFTPVIRKIAQAIQLTDGRIVIAGHTDNVPIHNERFRSNWDLSAARAVTLLHRLRQAAKLAPERFVVQGYADTRPLAPNDTASSRARNRRVEVVLVHGGAAVPARGVEEALKPGG